MGRIGGAGTLLAALLAAAAGCGPAAPAAPEGRNRGFLIYETRTRKVLVDVLGNESREEGTQRTYCCSYALRAERRGGAVVILRLDRKLMWEMDARTRTYRQATFAELAAAAEAARRPLALELEDAALAPDRQRAIEVALGRRRPRVEVRAGEESIELLGRSCRRVAYLEDGALRIEEWTTADLAAPCDLTEPLALTGDFSPELLAELRSRRGFSLRARIHGRLRSGPVLTETEVTALEAPESLPAGLFEIPAGYRRAGPAPGAR